MTIETKYNINDKVYFIATNKIHLGKIYEINNINIYNDGNNAIVVIKYNLEYGLKNNKKLITLGENDLFPTREKLIETL